MTRAFIGIGTNLGDRNAQIEFAFEALGDLPMTSLVAASEIYETEPQGPLPQGKFLNAAAEIKTELGPLELLDAIGLIERNAGRAPKSQRTKWGARELDLDILFFGQRVIASDCLSVPHPFMHERWFVLKPLADLDPQAMHATLQMTVAELLEDVEKPSTAGI